MLWSVPGLINAQRLSVALLFVEFTEKQSFMFLRNQISKTNISSVLQL